MQISGIQHLHGLLGRTIRFFASTASVTLSPTGATVVGAHVFAIPLEDYSAGRAYYGDFLEMSAELHQTEFGSDFHQLCVVQVPVPSDAGPRIVAPDRDQYPFEGYPNFFGEYFRAPLTKIEVFESVVTTEEVNGDGAEHMVLDSHIRFGAGECEVVLTIEQGTILGEIELHAGNLGTAAPYALDAARSRVTITQ